MDYFEAAKRIARTHTQECLAYVDLEAHIQDCERCRKKLHEFIRTWDEFKKITDPIKKETEEWEHA